MPFSSWLTFGMTDAFNHTFQNFLKCDDVGKSAKLVFVAKPSIPCLIQSSRKHSKLASFDLGLTFVEMDGRAYVRDINPSSNAYKNGVQSQDCVQFALILDEKLNKDEEQAISYALKCEKEGMRTSYAELKTFLDHRNFLDVSKRDNLIHSNENDSTMLRNIDLDFFISQEEYYTESSFENNEILFSMNPHFSTTPETLRNNLSDSTHDEKKLQEVADSMLPPIYNAAYSIIFIFRRERQRLTSKILNSPIQPSLFCMNDECEHAAGLLNRLAPVRGETFCSEKFKGHDLIYNGTKWIYPSELNLSPSTTIEQCNVMTKNGKQENEEVKEIYELIKSAVGLAFVRISKVVLGVSLNAGSGIVISKLPDGTWSPPSAIGMMGAGLGLQFGIEMADYIFILQTQESLDNFRNGGQFRVGGNIADAFAGIGKVVNEASKFGNSLCSPTSLSEYEMNFDSNQYSQRKVASEFYETVAFAKNQGVYLGASADGNKFYTRSEINSRSYKFATGKNASARDILDGKVEAPHEAQNLYASLRRAEYWGDISKLPKPPKILLENIRDSWDFEHRKRKSKETRDISALPVPEQLLEKNKIDCNSFREAFEQILYGGVSVKQIIPNSNGTSNVRVEQRTLWLKKPAKGSLRLGFLRNTKNRDKLEPSLSIPTQNYLISDDFKYVDHTFSGKENVRDTCTETEIVVDGFSSRDRNACYLSKDVVALTDVVLINPHPITPLRMRSEDDTEHLRIINLVDVFGTSIMFVADNCYEWEFLVCGLKLLIVFETNRLGVRCGFPFFQNGGKVGDNTISPALARGYLSNKNLLRSNEIEISEREKNWCEMPSRTTLRNRAVDSLDTKDLFAIETRTKQKKIYGHVMLRDLTKGVKLHLPLKLCRALLLDSGSPLAKLWESECGDNNLRKSSWNLPKGLTRNIKHPFNDCNFIASGDINGAYRHVTYGQHYNGRDRTVSEIHTVCRDNSDELALLIKQRLLSSGFSTRIQVTIFATTSFSCLVQVTGEACIVAKKAHNQADKIKDFHSIFSAINDRYGVENKGMLACFLKVMKTMQGTRNLPKRVSKLSRKNLESNTSSSSNQLNKKSKNSSMNSNKMQQSNQNKKSGKKPDRNHVKIDPLKIVQISLSSSSEISSLKSFSSSDSGKDNYGYENDGKKNDIINKSKVSIREVQEAESHRRIKQRPGTPALDTHGMSLNPKYKKDNRKKYSSDKFANMPIITSEGIECENVKPSQESKNVTVKPLPKIRLSLMPSPLEKDEELYYARSKPRPLHRNKLRGNENRSKSHSKLGAY